MKNISYVSSKEDLKITEGVQSELVSHVMHRKAGVSPPGIYNDSGQVGTQKCIHTLA